MFAPGGSVHVLGRRGTTVPGFFDLFEHVVHYDRRASREILQRAGFGSVELLPAPPTNPFGHYLNVLRTLTYRIARVLHRVGFRPGPLTHGLLILACR